MLILFLKMNKTLFRSVLNTLGLIIFKQVSIFPFWFKCYPFYSYLKLYEIKLYTIHIISSALCIILYSMCQTINVCCTWRRICEKSFSWHTSTKHFKAEQRISLRSNIKNSFWSWIFSDAGQDSMCLLSLVRHLFVMRLQIYEIFFGKLQLFNFIYFMIYV